MHKHVTMVTMVSESRRLVIQCYKVLLVSTTEYSVCIPQGFCSDWLFSHTQQSTVEASTATHIASHHMTQTHLYIVPTYSTFNIATAIPLMLYSEQFSPALNSGTQPNCKRIVNSLSNTQPHSQALPPTQAELGNQASNTVIQTLPDEQFT